MKQDLTKSVGSEVSPPALVEVEANIRHTTLAEIDEFDNQVQRFEEEIDQVKQKCDWEALVASSQDFIGRMAPLIRKCREDLSVLVKNSATNPAVVARMGTTFYTLLRVHPQLAIRHPALSKVLQTLRESGSQLDWELLKRISARLAQPESKPHFSENELLEMYEKLHVRAGNVCKNCRDNERKNAIRKAFPELGNRRLIDSNKGVDIEAGWVAINILAVWLGSNANLLEKRLVEANRNREASKAQLDFSFTQE